MLAISRIMAAAMESAVNKMLTDGKYNAFL